MRLVKLAGGVLVAAWVLIANHTLLSTVRSGGPRPALPITDHHTRLAALAAAAPEDLAYGFVTDGNKLQKYFMSQYVLIPRILTYGAGEPQVIGVFDGRPDAVLAAEGLRVVRDFGRGVFLLEKVK
jgi:hypothetical protein